MSCTASRTAIGSVWLLRMNCYILVFWTYSHVKSKRKIRKIMPCEYCTGRDPEMFYFSGNTAKMLTFTYTLSRQVDIGGPLVRYVCTVLVQAPAALYRTLIWFRRIILVCNLIILNTLGSVWSQILIKQCPTKNTGKIRISLIRKYSFQN